MKLNEEYSIKCENCLDMSGMIKLKIKFFSSEIFWNNEEDEENYITDVKQKSH